MAYLVLDPEVAGGTLASTAGANRGSSVLADSADIRARLREQDILASLGGAAVSSVGDKHVGPAVDRVRRSPLGLLSGTTNGDTGAVHVHLAVTHVVEPSPGKESIARGCVSGDGEVPLALERAAANVRVDDLPRIALVEGERSLAAATIVSSRAGDGQALGLASLPVGYGSTLGGVIEGVVALARKVAARVAEWIRHAVVDVCGEGIELGAERRRVAHLHVGMGHGSEAENGGNREGLHCEGRSVVVESKQMRILLK